MKTVLSPHGTVKCLPKSFKGFCGKRRQGSSGFLVAAAVFAALLPVGASAQVANFAFTTDPQTIEAGAVSGQITVQAQDAGGASINIPQTACLSFSTASAQGQFSSSATSWTPVSVLTMSKNTANKSFYYKDTADGIHTLTVKVALKPVEISGSCASWPTDQWSVQWTATQNITVGNVPSGENSSSSNGATSTQTTSQGNSYGDFIMPPPPTLFADGGSDRIVVVGADTEFRARAYDEKKNIIDFLRFRWNFGDGSVSDATNVLHRFEYPGRYIVVLDIPQEKDAVADQIVVTVERVELALSLMEDGGVAIENRSGHTFDLSQWIIRSTGRAFTVPARTLVLTGSSLRISQKTLGFSGSSDIELDYPNGTFALSTAVPPVPTSTPPVQITPVPHPQNPAENRKVESRAFVPEEESLPVEQPEVVASTTQAAAAGAALPSPSGKWWLGVVGIAGLAAGSLALARRYGRKEWDIEEG